MSGGILCKGVVLKVHRVINYNSMYIIIGYDVSTPLMTMYEIMTLCKHGMDGMQRTPRVPPRVRIKKTYESFSDLGEIRVWWRAHFQSGSRVLKKVF